MRKTFLEIDRGKQKDEIYDFCFLGVNCCSAEYLSGVEKAADTIRALSFRYANADGTSTPIKVYSPEEGYILKDITACDLGNVDAYALDKLSEELGKVEIPEECIPIFVGGDHSVTYELVNKVLEKEDEIVVIQFDAHSDYIDEYREYPHGSVMREVGKIDKVIKIIHFGIRGNLNCKPAIDDSVNDGNIVVPYVDIENEIDKVKEYLKDKSIYITFDTDFLNPIYASATNCPEPGGPSYDETLKYLRLVIEFSHKIVGLDFVEYNPTCEGSNITGITIVNLLMECMHSMKIKS